MKTQCYNPYLPLWEYIPDGEPHVFGNRVYLYGSHDRAGGTKFCMNDYVCWSADVSNLKQWRYEGVIYRRDQDPRMKDGTRQLWALDVVRGKDGRYYLYYCPDGDGEAIGVAVCEEPAGTYEFYGIVHDKEGRLIGKREGDIWQFDPGVFIDDDGKIYLYSGNGPKTEADVGRSPKSSCVMELSDDMLTIKEEPRRLIPILGESDGTGFEGHEFFEASSIRKIGECYYLIYSSVRSRELCYAVSDHPDRGYEYGGVVSDNSGIREEAGQKRMQIMWGNNHGGIEQINGKWYIFYHRPTNRTQFSRQGCAEPIIFSEDGKIVQAEMTSQGLNGKPLDGKGTYPAAIACILHGKEELGISRPYTLGQPYVTQDMPDFSPEKSMQQTENKEEVPYPYLTQISDGAVIGYKYFAFHNLCTISVKIRHADGELYVKMIGKEDGNETKLCRIPLKRSEEWTEVSAEIIPEALSEVLQENSPGIWQEEPKGQIGTLLFTYHGSGSMEFLEFSLN